MTTRNDKLSRETLEELTQILRLDSAADLADALYTLAVDLWGFKYSDFDIDRGEDWQPPAAVADRIVAERGE